MIASMILSALLVVAAVGHPPDLPSRFRSLLERDDVAAIVAAGPESPGPFDLFDLRLAAVRHECIAVHAMSVATESATDDSVTLRIDLSASGITPGAIKVKKLLPQIWFVTFAKKGEEWKLMKARTREGRLVDQILAAPNDAARWELFRQGDPDLDAVARALNYRIDENEAIWPFALALASSTGDITTRGHAFGHAASVFRHDTARANDYVREERRYAELSGNPDAINNVNFNEAVVAWFARDIDGAVAAFTRCAAAVDRVTDPRNALMASHMVGHLELGRGNVIKASEFSQRSAELARKYQWAEGEINALSQLVLIHTYVGNNAEASVVNREVYRRAVALGRRESIGAALHNMGAQEMLLGNYAEAEALYVRASALWMDAAARLPARIGELRVLQERFDDAEPYYRQALEKAREGKDGNDEISMLTALSKLALRRGRADEALALARDALAARGANPEIRAAPLAPPWETYSAEGAALAALGRRAEAAAAFETAIAFVETEMTISSGEASHGFLGHHIEPFVALMRLRVGDGAATEALSVSERVKARVLHDLLERGRVDLRAVYSREERAEEEALNARLVEANRAVVSAGSTATAALRETLEKARREQRAFAVQMQLAHRELRNTVSAPTPDDVRAWIDRGSLVPSTDSVVLDYIVDERETTLFVLARDASGATDVRTLTLPITKKELARGVERLVSEIERRDLGYVDAAEELYRRLLAPAAAMLAGKKNICIIPHGALWQLPFAVLRAPDGKHLVERAAIHYAPSLAYLNLYAGRSRDWLKRSPSVLALGNPAIADASLSRVRAWTRAALGALPEAATEAREVGRLYGGGDVLVSGAATEEAVKAGAGAHEILHFATHAISQATQPMYSSLVLATQSDREDGLLEAREIVRMDLRAELAVLSACETARGDISEGEGVVGLSWAFLVAGCPRTIVTQWRADSAAAAKTMILFHRRIAATEGGGSVAGALRDAQLAVLRTPRFSHPYYWGGFVAVGAGW